MFLDSFLVMLDDKGRFAVPKKFRDQLIKRNPPEVEAVEVVITIEHDELSVDQDESSVDQDKFHLEVHPRDEWKKHAKKMRQLSGLRPDAQKGERKKAREHRRRVMGNAHPTTLDSHGRLLISSYQRGRLGLDQGGQERQQVRLIGADQTFEIWNESRRKKSSERE